MITPGPEHCVLAAAANPNTASGPQNKSDKQRWSKTKAVRDGEVQQRSPGVMLKGL